MTNSTIIDCSTKFYNSFDVLSKQGKEELVLLNCDEEAVDALHHAINAQQIKADKSIILLPTTSRNLLDITLFFLKILDHLQPWSKLNISIHCPTQNKAIRANVEKVFSILEHKQVFRKILLSLDKFTEEPSIEIGDTSQKLTPPVETLQHKTAPSPVHSSAMDKTDIAINTAIDNAQELLNDNNASAQAIEIAFSPATLQALKTLDESIFLLYTEFRKKREVREADKLEQTKEEELLESRFKNNQHMMYM